MAPFFFMVVDEERMRPVGNFSDKTQCFDFHSVF